MSLGHKYCRTNCGSTACTASSTVTRRCNHDNGWHVNVKFFIWTKRIFVCSDCGADISAPK